jgi:hypothetical protein
LKLKRKGWALPVRVGVRTDFSGVEGVDTKRFPSGLSSVPIKVKIIGEKPKTFDLDLVAGFLAVKQNVTDLALSTVIGWTVAARPPNEPILLH